MSPRLDRRVAGMLAAALAVLVVALVAIFGGAGDPAEANAAARLVPADALLYVHASTDRDRDAAHRLAALLERFPAYPALRDRALGALRATGQGLGVDFRRDIRPWLGREAALALLNTKGSVAGSLILIDVSDRNGAEGFLARAAGSVARSSYRGVPIETHGGVATAFIGRMLAIGQRSAVAAAIDAHAGRRRALADDPSYRRAAAGEAVDRAFDAYASAAGVRRVLEPQAGTIGTLGALLDRPGLTAVGLAASARGDRLAVHIHQLIARGTPATGALPQFSPGLLGEVPASAIALAEVHGIDLLLPRLLTAAGNSTLATRIAQIIGRVRAQLAGHGTALRDLGALFSGDTAVFLLPHLPAPTLALVARAPDESRARVAFAELQGPLASLFRPSGQTAGQAPVFADRHVAGITVHQLVLAAGLELDYAIFDGKLVAANGLDAIAAVAGKGSRIGSSKGFGAVLGARPSRVTSLLFLDLSRLLGLGEQTGLARNPRYLAVRGDLKRVHAVGLSSARGETDSTVELYLQIS